MKVIIRLSDKTSVIFETSSRLQGSLVTIFDNLREATESSDPHAEERVIKLAISRGEIK